MAVTVTAGSVISRTETEPVALRFSYDRRQPFTVVLDMSRPSDPGTSRWSFARDLLQSGMHRPSGEGTVRIWPPCRCNNRPDVRLLLGTDTGTVLLDVPVQPLREWLNRTWEAVPPGEESARIDWDTLLERLLDNR
ncbi:SsgA family sporulation/cell division regulator [Streptomyces sp. NPDC057325]|uniref:SsgA family sporulation/cell division regulator n=1 Tax=unclassified Streptomyces TaxID=2593676 RepID=UPI0036253CE0